MKNFILLAIASIIWTGCEKKEKKSQSSIPEISVTNTNYAVQTKTICGHDEQNVLVLPVSDTLRLSLSFKAARALSQYKLEVHENFNCHGHERINRTPWTYQNIVAIEDGSMQKDVTIDVPIPALASLGNYHFKIQLLDENGNEAMPVEYNVVLFNKTDTIAPDVVVVAPSLDDELMLQLGDSFTVIATVSDNGLLSDGYYKISIEDEHGQMTTLQDVDFPATAVNTANINTIITVPNTVSKGHQHLILEVYDSAGNVTKNEWSIDID